MTVNLAGSEIVKGLKARRKSLCFDRRVWSLKVPGFLPIDYMIGCRKHAEADLLCEGCCAGLHRADRLDEIAAGIAAIDAEITTITGKPYMTAKPARSVLL